MLGIVLACSVALMVAVISDYGTEWPPTAEHEPEEKASASNVLPLLEARGMSDERFGSTNLFTLKSNPFFTAYFIPPAPPAPEPVPMNRTVPVLYQGFYENDAGARKAFVQVEDQQRVVGIGDVLAGSFTVQWIYHEKLVLQNARGHKRELAFRTPDTVELPIE